jgi:hypothetical protein
MLLLQIVSLSSLKNKVGESEIVFAYILTYPFILSRFSSTYKKDHLVFSSILPLYTIRLGCENEQNL